MLQFYSILIIIDRVNIMIVVSWNEDFLEQLFKKHKVQWLIHLSL